MEQGGFEPERSTRGIVARSSLVMLKVVGSNPTLAIRSCREVGVVGCCHAVSTCARVAN